MLARSSQPGYPAGDSGHTLREWDVGFLRANKIVCFISANERNMDADSKARLAKAGIEFHDCKVKDYTATTVRQLTDAAALIEACRTRDINPGATLLYCGHGQGRTGTFVAAWALKKFLAGDPAVSGANTFNLASFLKPNFGVERDAQAWAVTNYVTDAVIPVALPTAAAGVSGISVPLSNSRGSFRPNFSDNDNCSAFNPAGSGASGLTDAVL